MSNTIRWFKSAEMDAPDLNSPQPCPRGVRCDYRIEKAGELVPACCRFVHPGEEGNGRRIFPAREVKGTGAGAESYKQPACVRLTGGAGFYERRRLRLSWGEWCEKKGIPYTPVKAGERWEPVTLGPIGGERRRAGAPPSGGSAAAAPQRPSRNQRQRTNNRARAPPPSAAEVIDTRTEEETMGPEVDCHYCHPDSGCDGDHGDEMRAGGGIVRRRAVVVRHTPATPPPPLQLSMGGSTLLVVDETDCGCSTPSLLAAPISCSDLDVTFIAAEGKEYEEQD